MRIALQESLLGESTTYDLFERAAAVGVDGVELIGAGLEDRVPELAQESQRTGVRVAGIHFGKQGALLSDSTAEREAALVHLRSNIACAVDLDASGVVVVPHYGDLLYPDLTPWMSPGELHAEMLHMHLRTLSDFAHALGSKLYIQPASKRETRFISRLEQADAVVKRIKHPDVKIAVELGCLSDEKPDAARMGEALTAFAKNISYVSLPMDRPLVGAVLDALNAAGYDGWLTLTGAEAQTASSLRERIGRLRDDLRPNIG